MQEEIASGTQEREAPKEPKQFNERRLWTLLAALLLLSIYLKTGIPILFHRAVLIENLYEIFSDNIFSIFLIVLLPTLFRQTFGLYPIEYFTSIIRSRNADEFTINLSKATGAENLNTEKQLIDGQKLTPKEHQLIFIKESHLIAEKIYNRAGTYLLIGCTIAFSGIGIFNSPLFTKNDAYEIRVNEGIKNALSIIKIQPIKQDSASNELLKAIKNNIAKQIVNGHFEGGDEITGIEQKLLDYLPRFGALFLLEFIAFFFLRQYRIMLEEYRYYESIKRRRQENLIFIELLDKYPNNQELVRLISEKFQENNSHKLHKDDTTQTLEIQKITSQELDIFGKLTDLIKSVKAK